MSALGRATTRVSLLAALLAATTSGCGTEWRSAQTARAVMDPASERYWVTGNYGFAAEGRAGVLSRADYDEPDGAPDWAWDTMMSPGGFVVSLRGKQYLFTHGGSVLRRDGATWTQLQIDLAPGQDSVQVNDALVGPDGRLFLHLHADVLVFAEPDGLERGILAREKTPSYFSWIGYVDGTLHGIGWDGKKSDRALYRRSAVGRWDKVAVLPTTSSSDTALVFGVGARGDRAVVIGSDVAIVDVTGAVRAATADELIGATRSRAPLKMAGDDPVAASVAAPVAAAMPAPALSPAPPPASPISPPPDDRRDSPPQGAHVMVPASPTPPAPHGLRGAFPLPSGRAALVLEQGGSPETIAIVGRDGVTLYRCDILRVRSVVGVIEGRDRIFAISHLASVLELHADSACGEPQPPLIPE